jgi:hypothetical protein
MFSDHSMFAAVVRKTAQTLLKAINIAGDNFASLLPDACRVDLPETVNIIVSE